MKFDLRTLEEEDVWTHSIGVGMGAITIFRLGAQKLAKNNQDNQIQNTVHDYNSIQYVFFEKRYILCTMGSAAKPPEYGEFSRMFVLKL